ncbi:MAG: hypothetical protein GQ531_07255 [Sulfurovum sp.]|nr:hypothetical protein [Sulfurovum sp.]
MSNQITSIIVNEKRDYHNCEMTFSCSIERNSNNFEIDQDQPYIIYTTLKEVEVLNEALAIYQAEGFKEKLWRYTNEVDASTKYPEFVKDSETAKAIGKKLNDLCQDSDSLVQLQEYCMEQAPTYADDFNINKSIDAITIDNDCKEINGYEDLKSYLLTLKETKANLFA